MKDNTVGRINHKGHKHPDTATARKHCREAMIAAARKKAGRGQEDKQAAPVETVPNDYPEVAEVAPSKATPVIRRGRQAAPKKRTLVTRAERIIAAEARGEVIPQNKAVGLDSLREVAESLDSVEQALTGNGVLEGAAIRLRVFGVPIVAVYEGSGWNLSIG